MRYYPKRITRVSPGFTANPEKIVPFGNERVVRWHYAGRKYGLGYTPWKGLFGTKLRRIRLQLLASMKITIIQVRSMDIIK
jgi:hypothetical protein